MEEVLISKKCPIAGLNIEQNFKKYSVSIKAGMYYTFTNTQLSNQMHYHDSYELVVVLSGRGTFVDGENSRSLSRGDIYLSDPGVEHEIHIEQTESLTVFYAFVHISKKNDDGSYTAEEKLLDQFLERHNSYATKQSQLLADFEFFDLYTQNPKFMNIPWLMKSFENLIYNCMERLTESFKGGVILSKKNELQIFERALDYIDQNIAYKITADSIADAVFTSKRNLYLIFKKNLNRTVHDYINDRKISLAEHYLKMNMSVTETANLIGIENISYFSRLFKKYRNVSPREFKKEAFVNQEGHGRRYF